VEPPRSTSFQAPVHSTQGGYSARDVVTHITGAPKEVAIGALLEGKVMLQTSSGLTTLKTPHGEISFQTQIGLLRGSLVTLRVVATGNDFQARLVTVNGQNLMEYLGTNPANNVNARVTTPFVLPQDEVNQSSGQSGQSTTSQQQAVSGDEQTFAVRDVTSNVLQKNTMVQALLLAPQG